MTKDFYQYRIKNEVIDITPLFPKLWTVLTSTIQRPESSVQRPESCVQSPASRVQRPEFRVQLFCPDASNSGMPLGSHIF